MEEEINSFKTDAVRGKTVDEAASEQLRRVSASVCVSEKIPLWRKKKGRRGRTDVSSLALKGAEGPSWIRKKKQQLVAPEAPKWTCAAQSSGVAVGDVGGPQLGHPLAQVVHELKHGGGEAGLDEVARQATLRNNQSLILWPGGF